MSWRLVKVLLVLGCVLIPGIATAQSAIAGVGAALVVGALAGLSPAARAARLNPADAVRPV